MAICSVIKYEGDNNTFIWKHPDEDFNTSSQLIVHENQEAIFFMNGQALDTFGPGRHTLRTENIPFIGKFLRMPTGSGKNDENPFHCEVYFINKTTQMAIKWGTDSKVQYMDPQYNFPLSIGASGEMCLVPSDSRKLLLKLVGTENVLYQSNYPSNLGDHRNLVSKFRGILMTRVKTYIAKIIKEQAINIFEIDEKLTQFSENLHQLLIPDFEDYGLCLERFYVTNIVKPEGERSYEKFKDLHFRQYADIKEAEIHQKKAIIDAQTAAQREIIASQARAVSRQQEGYTYQEERSFEVAGKVAENESIGQFTGMGVGLGTMAGVGGIVGGMVTGGLSAVNNVQQAPAAGKSLFCMECGTVLPEGAKFCLNCGTKVAVKNTCPDCGSEIPTGAKFCMNCGKKMD